MRQPCKRGRATYTGSSPVLEHVEGGVGGDDGGVGRRGRVDEGPCIVEQIVLHDGVRHQDRSRRCQRLAKRVQPSEHPVLEPEHGDTAPSPRSVDPGSMGLVDNQMRVPNGARHLDQRRKRAVHAVQALHGDKDAVSFSYAARCRVQRPAQGVDGVVGKGDQALRVDPGGAHAVVHGGMDVLVVQDRVPVLWNARKKGDVGVESRVEEQSGLCPEEAAEAVLELGVGEAVDEEARAAGAEDVRGGVEPGEEVLAEVLGGGEGEVVVGGEVGGGRGGRGEAAAGVAGVADGEGGVEPCSQRISLHGQAQGTGSLPLHDAHDAAQNRWLVVELVCAGPLPDAPGLYAALKQSILANFGDAGWGAVAASLAGQRCAHALFCLTSAVRYFSPMTGVAIVRVGRDAHAVAWGGVALLRHIGPVQVVPHVVHIAGAWPSRRCVSANTPQGPSSTRSSPPLRTTGSSLPARPPSLRM